MICEQKGDHFTDMNRNMFLNRLHSFILPKKISSTFNVLQFHEKMVKYINMVSNSFGFFFVPQSQESLNCVLL